VDGISGERERKTVSNFPKASQSNRPFSAVVRDDELGAVNKAEAPADLRGVPIDQWDCYVQRDVTLPPDVANYLDGRELRPLTKSEIDRLENQIAKFHNVQPPYCIVCSLELQRTGRAWLYVPEVAPYVTGFYLDRFE
jgi:hypothetical protein